jgi:hypothetical protein
MGRQNKRELHAAAEQQNPILPARNANVAMIAATPTPLGLMESSVRFPDSN